MPTSGFTGGRLRTDAKPPLFASEISPSKTAVPFSVVNIRLRESPPITPSLTIIHRPESSPRSNENSVCSAMPGSSRFGSIGTDAAAANPAPGQDNHNAAAARAGR